MHTSRSDKGAVIPIEQTMKERKMKKRHIKKKQFCIAHLLRAQLTNE